MIPSAFSVKIKVFYHEVEPHGLNNANVLIFFLIGKLFRIIVTY